MERIKIKRATTKGLIDATGILLNVMDHQFCLTEFDDDEFDIIELSTGCSAGSFHSEDRTCVVVLIAEDIIKEKSVKELNKAIAKAKKIYSEKYGFSMPVNEPVRI